MVFGEPRSEWRRSRHEAMMDAIRLELASWDGERREHFLAVPVSMERRRQRIALHETGPEA